MDSDFRAEMTRATSALRLFLTLALACSSAFFPARARAYGREGHQAIAELARGMLRPQTKTAVAHLLGSADLARVATWADELKQARKHRGPLSGDAEAREFNFRFPENPKWHFVNLPLGTRTYTDQGPFSSERDIVHEIGECVRILETPAGRATRFEKKQALRLLIHLVGDIHQPLHVGTGYYELGRGRPRLIIDPSRAKGLPDDEGGNLLQYGTSHFSELHGYWDNGLVEKAAHTRSYRKLALVLRARVEPRAWKDKGDYHQWAERWATDSIHQARAAYEGIVFLSVERKRSGKPKLIRIQLPSGYERSQQARASDQLAKAGFHLAELLNAIQWR